MKRAIYGLKSFEGLKSYRSDLMVNKMPEWMSLRKEDSSFYKFLNFGVNLTLDDLGDKIKESFKNLFITKADLSMMSSAFRINLKDFEQVGSRDIILKDMFNIKNNFIIQEKSKVIKVTTNSLEFFKNKDFEMVFLDLEDNNLYFEKEYKKENIKINYEGSTFIPNTKLTYHKIWNVFDEFGLLVGLDRLPRETNANFKKRILDVFKNPGNSTGQGLINSISRELGLEKDEIDINFLNDPKYKEKLFRVDNSPTREMLDIISIIDRHFNIYWDDTKWDIDYWDSIPKSGKGYSTLSTPVDYKEIKKSI